MKSASQTGQTARRAPRPHALASSEIEELRAAIDQRVAPQFGDLATLVFQALVLRRGAFHVRHLEWWTTARPDVAWSVVCSSSNRGLMGEDSWVFELDGTAVRLFLSPDGVAKASLAAVDWNRLDVAERTLHALLPPDSEASLPEVDAEVPIRFWCYGVPSSTRRRLPTPAWTEIECNYTVRTRAMLQPLFVDPDGRDPGQLILWHGEPGTGKTYAIRALAQAWSPWCDIHYVTDPEVFFGPTASYMRDVLIDSDGYYARDFGDPDLNESGLDERWRLLVLEDTGELLGVDAKMDTGQGLSRLLNVVDGFLGQGLKLLILITTNESLARLHPAVVRPGRCAAVVEFERFTATEANRWLQDHGRGGAANGAVTLAELYGMLAGRRPPAARRSVGFV